jgi:hypothetical protein
LTWSYEETETQVDTIYLFDTLPHFSGIITEKEGVFNFLHPVAKNAGNRC